MSRDRPQIHWRHIAAPAALAMVLPWPTQAAENSFPDFSGRWGRNAFGFEPLPGHPSPITNLERLPNGIGDANKLVGDYRNPLLKPQAAETVRKLGEISRTGQDYPDPSNHCSPYAPPFTFAMQLGLEILQAKDRITLIYNQDDQVRHVRLNGSHPAKIIASPMGDSIGHYEGDTLVIDTIGIKIGAINMIDRYGTPHSEALHVIERYRLIDAAQANEAAERYQKLEGPAGLGGVVAIDPNHTGPGLQLQFTVEDENIFTKPWTAGATYRRLTGTWVEQICAENTFEYYSGKPTAIPTANRPDF